MIRVESAIIAIFAVLVGLLLGVVGGFFGRMLISRKQVGAANSEAERILEKARETSRERLVEAKEEALSILSSSEKEIRERRSELQRTERRMANLEENCNRRASNLDKRERKVARKENEAAEIQAELESIRQREIEKLESVANLSTEEAKAEVVARAEEDIQYEVARRYRDVEQQAMMEVDGRARMVLSQAIHRLASDVVSEATVTSVPLPSDDMKGRLIGREGRNIRAIEKAMGVDLIIDETPEAVMVSCFDPVRREIARVALSKLISDGRIHPARIEEMVERAEKEVGENVWKCGQDAIFETGVQGLHPEVVRLLGRLKYRYSYGENVLQHSIEVSHLAAMMAGEVGANVKVARTGGLLHDIGKALTHEVEGPHAEIGADVARRYNVAKHVCSAIAEHHDDVMSSAECFIVAAADAISAARPGARRDTVEQYTKRLRAIEDVCRGFDGVDKSYAIQAGREVRVLVNPSNVDDVTAAALARDIAKKIEDNLAYPGQIKITVIRESRAVQYAR